MSKCPNCGMDVEAGAKFCMECGTPIPQTKECPACHAQWPLTAKFCAECGYNFSAGSAKGGSVIGDKNVIAGDVHIDNSSTVNNNTVNNVTNTTNNVVNNIINQDDTKKVVQCVVCGQQLQIINSCSCSKCGGHACKEHYDDELQMCTPCSAAFRKEAEASLLKFIADKFREGKNPVYANIVAKQQEVHIDDARLLALLQDGELEDSRHASWGFFDALRTIEEPSLDNLILLAEVYEQGIGCEKCHARAVATYRKAAKRGDKRALDKMSEWGEKLELPEEYVKIKLCDKAVSFGRRVFETPEELFALSREERSQYVDPSACPEHFIGLCVTGNTLTVTSEPKGAGKAWEVTLDASGSQFIKVIGVVRKANGMDLKSAKALVQGAMPAPVVVVTDEASAKEIVAELVAVGAEAHLSETEKELPPTTKEIKLDCGYGDGMEVGNCGIRYIKAKGEGPFPEIDTKAHPEKTCLYVARDAVGQLVWTGCFEGGFNPELLDVCCSTYYGGGDVEYTFFDHLEYDGKRLWPYNSDKPVDLGEKTKACYEGRDSGGAAYDMDTDTILWRAQISIMADWIDVGCSQEDGMSRLDKIRHREIKNFQSDYVDNEQEYRSLVGARLIVSKLVSGEPVGEWILDPRVASPITYEKEDCYFDWMYDFDDDANKDKHFLCAYKRYSSRGISSAVCVVVNGDFDPGKLKVRWQPLYKHGEDLGKPEEWVLTGISYDNKAAMSDIGDASAAPSTRWSKPFNEYIPFKDRADECPRQRWGSWILSKDGREMIDLWGDWVNA